MYGEDDYDNDCQELNILEEKIDTILQKLRNLTSADENRDEIYKQYYELAEQQYELEQALYFKKSSIIKSNGIIDLRLKARSLSRKNPVAGTYNICLHDEKTIIGEIQYRGYHVSEYLGDIGYGINPTYHGHNYAYQALCLLSELLNEEGIEDFWITTYDNNISSIKTIEKHGGSRFERKENNVLLYVCPTIKRQNLTTSSVKR